MCILDSTYSRKKQIVSCRSKEATKTSLLLQLRVYEISTYWIKNLHISPSYFYDNLRVVFFNPNPYLRSITKYFELDIILCMIIRNVKKIRTHMYP